MYFWLLLTEPVGGQRRSYGEGGGGELPGAPGWKGCQGCLQVVPPLFFIPALYLYLRPRKLLVKFLWIIFDLFMWVYEHVPSHNVLFLARITDVRHASWQFPPIVERLMIVVPIFCRMFSVVLSTVSINAFDVKALRAFRVLRPLKLVSGVPSRLNTVYSCHNMFGAGSVEGIRWFSGCVYLSTAWCHIQHRYLQKSCSPLAPMCAILFIWMTERWIDDVYIVRVRHYLIFFVRSKLFNPKTRIFDFAYFIFADIFSFFSNK